MDGGVFQISRSIIAEVIKFLGNHTKRFFTKTVDEMDLHDINVAVCDMEPSQLTYCRRMDLHHRLLVINSVLCNIFPSSHKDERRHGYLCALYAFHTEQYLDVAGLVLQEMNKLVESCIDVTPLPFGPLITDLLLTPSALTRAEDGTCNSP